MRLSLSGLLDRWLAPAPAPERVAWLRGATFAHRGLHGPGVPENSLAAAREALARGLGVECDVHRAADGVAVVFHDDTLARLTGTSGRVADCTTPALGRTTLTGSTEPIPTLRQLLDLMAGRAPLLIELKSPADRRIDQLCRAVTAATAHYAGPHGVMSFDPRIVRWFRRHAPATVRGLVVTEENHKGLRGRLRRHLALWLAAPDFLSYDIRDLPGPFPATQRRRGLPLATWTVRTPDLLARALAHADAPTVEGAGVP